MARDPTRALTVPGRLYYNPTTVGLAAGVAPYGGSELGIVVRWREVREQVYAYSNSEARGRDKVRTYGGRYAMSFSFVLVQYDLDQIDRVWAYSTTSPNGYSGANILTLPKAGQTTLSPGLIVESGPVLFAADDPAHPSTLILAPSWTAGAKLELDKVLDKPLEYGLVIVAGIDANGLDVREDVLQNLAVT